MSSSSGQTTQFRYTQTPSKVLHLRNLPWECTEEELVELCKPFGRIVNTKCNVGANRNQAFVEFADLNQAISMVSFYASSSEPAQVRGKTVYIQYSNRQEITNNKTSGDVAGNVLLVTIEGVEAGDVSIDVIHLVFSAFGFVHKIATFEKAAGFQALIQFSDADTASAARNALDGRSIPRYLLPEHVGSCHLRISYSAHTDLNIKFQSHRSRDYTNPYLPVNASAIEGTMQPVVGPDGKKKEPESNVLLASIENMQYAVTVDVLHTVFSAFGAVQKIAIFEKNGGTQALIQYPDIATAALAKEALEGHCIYDGGYCAQRKGPRLHHTRGRHPAAAARRRLPRAHRRLAPRRRVRWDAARPPDGCVGYAGGGWKAALCRRVPDSGLPAAAAAAAVLPSRRRLALAAAGISTVAAAAAVRATVRPGREPAARVLLNHTLSSSFALLLCSWLLSPLLLAPESAPSKQDRLLTLCRAIYAYRRRDVR